jgi:adenine-specific DNA-methyltransferase
MLQWGASALEQLQPRDLLVLARRTAQRMQKDASTPAKRLRFCKRLLLTHQPDPRLETLKQQLSRLPKEERHYWIGTFYALLLPAAERRSKATYFTPPHLARSIVTLACQNGFDIKKHTAIDPAAGGAAFLSTLALQMREGGLAASSITSRLCGVELDSGLATLSETLIGDQLGTEINKRAIVAVGNSLKRIPDKRFDLVLANPPYGRISLGETTKGQWEEVCHPGHINKYALFTELCFRLVKRNGLVGLMLPSSFVAGPLYDKLRAFLRQRAEILALGSVAYRNDIFIDVDQDISVVLLRAGQPHRVTVPVVFGSFHRGQTFKAKTAAVLPLDAKEPWVIPANVAGTATGGATLDDYGVTARAGYFVWNREQERMLTRKRRKLDIPLIWAQNVRAGRLCSPKSKKRARGIDYVRFEEESSAIVRKNAIVIQRTTNNSQNRRLIAACVDFQVVKKWGGFVSENHTIVISGDDAATINALCILLNSKGVDARYRQLSGTASISVTLLRRLDLPSPQALNAALARNKNIEQAVEEAYLASASQLSAAGA